MKRLIMLGVSLVALTWVTGCCHSCHSRCVDWDDGCCANACEDQSLRCKIKHRRRKDKCRDNCCQVDSFDSCCGDSGYSGMPVGGQVLPGYDTSSLQGGGCSGCAGGSTYGGLPTDPSSGWTIVPNSTTGGGSEPTPAPGASSGLMPIPTPASSIPAASPSVPPPPVSFNTYK
jgi:hypothetical protein